VGKESAKTSSSFLKKRKNFYSLAPLVRAASVQASKSFCFFSKKKCFLAWPMCPQPQLGQNIGIGGTRSAVTPAHCAPAKYVLLYVPVLSTTAAIHAAPGQSR
jgi:hypothetical protein